MGYDTRYTLSMTGESEDERDEILATAICDELTVGDFVDGDVDRIKWYEHEKDMLALSEKYPHVAFTLEGCGEDVPDLWKKYFLAGQMQRADAEITYAPCALQQPLNTVVEGARRKRLQAKLEAHFSDDEKAMLRHMLSQKDEDWKKNL